MSTDPILREEIEMLLSEVALYNYSGVDIQRLFAILERECQKRERNAVDQALALAYKRCCQGNPATYGPDAFYQPILNRLFPNVENTHTE